MTQCKICGGDQQPWLAMPIDAKKDEPTPFKTAVRCRACETGMLFPQPTPGQLNEAYRLPEYYTHGQSHIHDVQPGILDKLLTKVAWIVDGSTLFDPEAFAKNLPAGASICDLGCGHAELLHRFKELGFDNVIGVDPDPSSRECAAAAGINVLPGTAEAPPPELTSRQFDLVIMTHSLEHCLDPDAALRNAYRLTRDGGFFYSEVPNSGCVHFETLTVCSETFDAPRHLWFFTAEGLRRAVEKQGYAFESWRFAGFTRHHSPSWRAWEVTIFDRLAQRGEATGLVRHSYVKSLSILAKSAFAPPARKYDCVGVVARKLSQS